jgi:sec-independent protein translocase protein TatA
MLLGEIFGPDLLVVVIVLAVLLFGGSAIPKLARNLGSTKSEFEKGLKSSVDADDSVTKATDTAKGDK